MNLKFFFTFLFNIAALSILSLFFSYIILSSVVFLDYILIGNSFAITNKNILLLISRFTVLPASLIVVLSTLVIVPTFLVNLVIYLKSNSTNLWNIYLKYAPLQCKIIECVIVPYIVLPFIGVISMICLASSLLLYIIINFFQYIIVGEWKNNKTIETISMIPSMGGGLLLAFSIACTGLITWICMMISFIIYLRYLARLSKYGDNYSEIEDNQENIKKIENTCLDIVFLLSIYNK